MLSDLALDRPVSTVVLLTSLTVLGIVALFQLPLDFMPLVKEPQVDVEVPFPGSHPLESLRDVVLPIEEEVATIPDVKGIRSNAQSGSAFVEVQFEWEADIDLKKMEVREAVERARPRLPAGIGHIRVEGDTGGPGEGGSILQGRISAERDLSESWDLLDRRIRRPLERIKGVARVSLYGVEAQQVRIDLDLDALRRHGVRVDDLLRRVDAANLDLDLGAVRGDVIRYGVRAVGRFRDLGAVRDLPLGPAGARVRDVARVSLEEPRLDYGRHLDRKFAIGIDVSKEPTANTVETVDRLMERIREIERDPALAGIQLLVWLNQGDEIRSSLAGLRNSGMTGGLLAAGVLFFFLRRVRTTLVVSTAIPFSLLVTCGAMYLLGSQFNVLTLLGLMFGVGMLVDNAIVVVENIHRLEGLGVPPARAARVGARQVTLAVLASTATTIIVWSWLFVIGRSELTIYMGQVALTICLSVACSLLISVTFIPLAAARFAPHREVRPGFLHGPPRARVPEPARLDAAAPPGDPDDAAPARLERRDPDLAHREIRRAEVPAARGRHRVPGPRPRHQGGPRGVRESGRVVADHAQGRPGLREPLLLVQREPGVHDAGVPAAGRGERGGDRALRRKLQEGLPTIPGVKLEVGDREWWRRGAEGRRMVAVALHGEDPEYLETLASDVEERLRGLPDSIDVLGPSVQGQKEVRVRVDVEKAASAGLAPREVADAVAFAFRGQRLRRFEGTSGEIEVLVGLPENARPGLATLADLPLPLPGGSTVPLASIASVSMARTAPSIRREDRRTTTWVSVQFDEEKVTTEQGKARVAERMEGFALPAGYAWDWGQWGRDRDEGLGVMLQGVSLSLLVVVLLMAALFESFLQPFAIVITLPLAFFGAFWALWLLGYELDSVGFMGIVILIGIVVNNGIVMVDHVNQLRREGRARADALIEGCGDRLRPVLMTAITTIFGLLPLAFSAFTVAGAYVDSLAVGVLGGLATSTLFTLLALPVWYTAVEDLGALARKLPPRRVAPRVAESS